MAEEVWECPVGLTKEHAICIDDSDDDGEVEGVGTKVVHALSHHDSSGAAASRFDNNNGVSLYFKNVSKGSADEELISSAENDAVDISYSDNDNDDEATGQQQKENDRHGHRQDNIMCDENININGTPEGNNSVTTKTVEETPNSAKDTPKGTSILAVTVDEKPVAETSSRVGDDVKNDNPFASFAFSAGEASSSTSSWRPSSTKRHRESTVTNKETSQTQSASRGEKDTALANNQNQPSKKAKQSRSIFTKTAPKPKDRVNKTARALQSKQMTQSEIAEAKQNEKIERQILIETWHAFADPSAPIEQQRFQVLIAARIHAQCQEKMVTKAMVRLRTYFNEKDGIHDQDTTIPEQHTVQLIAQAQNQSASRGLTIHALANANPETEIAPLLSSVLFGNVKSKHIVQASHDVLKKFRGEVPESISSLKEITGIGPKLGEILNIVNRRATY